MLKTERNTPTMGVRAARAFRKSTQGYRFALPGELSSKLARHRRINANFEHGQWWITDLDTGAQWSVCDAAGAEAVDGFTFEQVSKGEGG